jgi:hypothetical protein
MTRRVFIVHRWYGTPEADWYPWLKKELENKGFAVFVPAMPNPDAPEIKSWVKTLSDAVGTPDKDTYFVGHSVGCQTILRYIEKLPGGVNIGGIVCVAGWFTLTPEATPTSKEENIAKPWITEPISTEKVKNKVKKIVAIFSEDDPYVPLVENRCNLKEFGAEIIVEQNKGHYDEDTKIFSAPSVLKAILEITK